MPLNRYSRYSLLFLCLFSTSVFAEEGKTSGFLSGLQQLRSTLGQDQEEQELLPPDEAFKLKVKARDANTLVAQFEPAKNYYLYKDKVAFKPQTPGTTVENISLPQGEMKSDVTFGEVEVFNEPFEALISLKRTAPSGDKLTLVATYQGCNEPIGVCYAPISKVIDLTLPVAKAAAGAVANAMSADASAATGSAGERLDATDELFQSKDGSAAIETESLEIERMFQTGNFWLILTGFFGIGLLLSFTPCVFPMFPILSGIIAKGGQHVTKQRGFILALAYVLGMAITYAIAGVAAGLSGAMLSATLQNAWVLGAFALIFVTLAFSMFGFYELQLPTFFQSKISEEAGHLKGGHLTSVFGMGALSALIVGPCVAAPLAGALLYISQTRDVVLGGSALFAMALGMGLPLLLLGASAGALLPKAGAWMEGVKQSFGVLLLGVAIWLISPVIPAVVHMLLWAALLIVSAIYLHAVDPLRPDASGPQKFLKGIGMIALLTGIALLVGVFSGSRDILQPLSKLNISAAGMEGAKKDGLNSNEHLPFQRVKSVAELNQQILQSRNKYVMLDFYADWCVSCKEMERFTFTDPAVQARLKDVVLLQVDVTAGTPEDMELLKRFKLFGPPAILFMDKEGRQVPNVKIIGYQDTPAFLKILNAVLI
ncbi:thiol:disulfide interchange protein DsbD [Nitrosospira multiformis ATCC 25196]|uniref:Thiol:disulfide interchange protein DsbD n=1 Tax=Nitrosospira multiformis (strain ATCC 25196 / NCIMB 11849 / C 71) TaxID=323848 RepID=Q2Y5K1_NITMU|nr:protein-disulfide reductase DsbD [Nitrosospira multiformis]ABB75970.1 Protein-disulfide reductase [Nitrosospira multiformis ATCC 25196]SEF79323.1 thiol:disulfide interchange protein DsbD [Nitrosospira multiformis ATCC 25196]